ncbi:MAG TPA: hypothetical protein VMV94_08980 [Phycisphaerae bacterium]|nr:hypothetical protein [Phycisphaerae bacterium]
MDVLTKLMVWLGDIAFAILSVFSPTVSLWIISAVTGVVMLFIWRYTSNQAAIGDVRRKIAANLLATRLFKDDISVTFRAQRRIIWQAMRLLRYSFQPMLIMMIPFVLIMVQIGLRYEHRPLPVGQKARVKVTLKEGANWKGVGDQIVLPDGLSRDVNDPCRAEALRTVDWRITPSKAGEYNLAVGKGADTIEVPLRAGDGFTRLSRLRGGSFWVRLLYSAEPSIPKSSVFESVEVYYPPRSTPLLWWDVHWLITLLILSIIFALIFKPILKVNI